MPVISHNYTASTHTDLEDPPAHMEAVYKTLKGSRKMMEDGEDLESVIRNAKRSAANRAIVAHKLDTEDDQHPPL